MTELWDVDDLAEEMALDAENEVPSDEETKSIGELANELHLLNGEIVEIENTLKIKQKRQLLLSEKLLPDAMLAVGVDHMGLTDGTELKVHDAIHTYISQKNEGEAFEWLRANGLGDIIDTNLVIPLGKGGNKELQDKIFSVFRQHLKDAPLAEDSSVHAQTLKATIKQQIKKSEKDKKFTVPTHLFGVQQRKVAKITKSKAKKD